MSQDQREEPQREDSAVEPPDLPAGFWREFKAWRRARRNLGTAGTITLRLDECDGRPPAWKFGIEGTAKR